MPGDDEAPDPRHGRSGSPLPLLLIVFGGLAVALVLAAGAGLFFVRSAEARREKDLLRAEVARAEELARVEAEAKAAGEATRVNFDKPVTIDGVTVRVVSIEVGKPSDRAAGGAVRELDLTALLVGLEVKAGADAKSFDLVPWWMSRADERLASDEVGNDYAGLRIPHLVGGSEPHPVRPDETTRDLVAIESPVAEAQLIRLDLPGKNVGVNGTFRFRIPRAAWEKK